MASAPNTKRKTLSVAKTPVGGPGDQPERVGLGGERAARRRLASVLVEEARERGGQLVGPDRAEVEALAAGEDGGGKLPCLGGGEDEDDVGRRLLEGLEEGVERRLREHVDLVDDVDLAAAPGGRVPGVLAKRPHLVDAAIAGPVDLDDVERAPRDHLAARLAGGARRRAGAAGSLAVEPHGQKPRRRRLADPSGAGEEVGVGDPLAREGVLQGPYDGVLPHDRVEGRGPPPPRHHLVTHAALPRGLSANRGRGASTAAGARRRDRIEQGRRSPPPSKKWPCTRRRYAPSCDLHGTPARARGSHGTREGLRTVAPFRAWRGWQIPVAWGPAFIAAPRGSVQHEGTSGGSSTPLERIAGTGHRYLPV